MYNDETKNKLYELAMQCNNYGYIIPELKQSIPLYRYRSNIEYAIDEINKEYIYLSPIENLNDPFDSSCKFTYEEALDEVRPAIYFCETCYFLKRKTWYDELAKFLKENDVGNKEMSMKEFFAFLEEKVCMKKDRIYAASASKQYYFSSLNIIHRRKYGNVASFSEVGDSILMWSYYANSHKGVCLKYEPRILDELNPEYKSIQNSIRKVWYSNIRYEDKESAFSPFVKSDSWSHEHEWRIFKEGFEAEKIKFPCLTAIYLGMNFDYQNDDLDRIIKAISNKNRNVELYFYSPSQRDFSLCERKINYKND